MSWTFLSNHAHVLLCIARDPQVRMSDIAREVEIGERAVHRIVSELADGGYLTWRKVGRRNVYQIDLDRPLRHPLEADHRIGDILEPLMRDPSRRAMRNSSGAAAS
jgi:DNA-binding IclR family transcriptional regulator